MILSARTAKIAAVALIAAAAGAGVAFSAPTVGDDPARQKIGIVSDAPFQPGQDGVDRTIVTGPAPSAAMKAATKPACADPARRGELRPCLN